MTSIMRRAFSRLKRKAHAIGENVRYYAIYPFAMRRYGHKEIYLIAERGTDARDNGYHFFKYIRENHPELEAYYVIRGDSADSIKVKELGDVVEYRSLKHYALFIAAKYKISTHIMGYSPDMLYFHEFNQKHRVPGRQIFLQHGVIKDDLVGLYQENAKVDVLICGAYPEYRFVQEKFHYRNNEVQYTGLARYDNLHDNRLKEQILVMPTWRQYLKQMREDERLNSDYFVYWNRLLHDRRIIQKLKERHMEMVFYPHYEMQPYIQCFSSGAEEIKVADFAHYDVQTLLKESKLLVTDFSSVFFDFAYMRKPCVYFQFDREMFYSTHYQKGYFDYETMGFGEVTTAYEDLVDTIVQAIEQGCKMKPAHLHRAIRFFPLHDANNCKRIMEAIQRLK